MKFKLRQRYELFKPTSDPNELFDHDETIMAVAMYLIENDIDIEDVEDYTDDELGLAYRLCRAMLDKQDEQYKLAMINYIVAFAKLRSGSDVHRRYSLELPDENGDPQWHWVDVTLDLTGHSPYEDIALNDEPVENVRHCTKHGYAYSYQGYCLSCWKEQDRIEERDRQDIASLRYG